MIHKTAVSALLTLALTAGCSSTGSQRLSSLGHPEASRTPKTQPAPGPQFAHQVNDQPEPVEIAHKPQTREHSATPRSHTINPSVLDPKPIKTIAAAPRRSPDPTTTTPPNIQHTLVREQALEILERAAFSEYALLRANAIEALHPVPSRLAPFVREALADPNPGVRYVAAMSVGKLRLAEFAPEAMYLEHDADPRVRAAALFAQTRNGFTPDLTPIADLLFNDDPAVRAQAAFILGELKNDSALPMLRAVASKHSAATLIQDRVFRLQLAEAMVKLGDLDAAQTIHVALYPALRDEFEAAVLAAQILGEIKDRQAIQQLVNVVEARLPAQTQTNRGSRQTPAVEPYLYPPELRLAAATSLAKMGYPDGVYVADEYAADADHLVRAQTTFLYAEAHRSGDLPRLVALMGDPSPIVQTAAASSVLRFLDPVAR